MLQKILLASVLLVLLAKEGLSQSQCYTSSGCTGGIVPAFDAKDCCVGTNDGQSYGIGPGNCETTQCIVRGFENAIYTVSEDGRLDTVFKLNVKGETAFPSVVVPGFINTESGEDTGDEDFNDIQRITVENVEDRPIRVFIIDDLIALEYNDSIKLIFTTARDDIIDLLEEQNEFIRDTAIVFIIDNDVLQINFNVLDYSIFENGTLPNAIRLLFQSTQYPFYVNFIPETIDTAEALSLGGIISSGAINNNARATAGPDEDFNLINHTVHFPARTTTFFLERFLEVDDDDTNEREQSFALIAEIGQDVPDRFCCFQTEVGQSDCIGDGRRGVARVRIEDNDPILIGFTNQNQTVNETIGAITVLFSTKEDSELSWEIIIRHQDVVADNIAIVKSLEFGGSVFDAQFGAINMDPLQENRPLEMGEKTIIPLLIQIIDDVLPEKTECFQLSISFNTNVSGIREGAECDDELDEFFCTHTICILDNDDPFEVAFVETTYTVPEDVGTVEVCVNLTQPQIDILDEFIVVEVIDFPSSVYIPADVTLATPDVPDILGRYFMMDGSDYEQQTNVTNAIDDETIRENERNEERRKVCYDQPIYDDECLEADEWLGLTLGVIMSMSSVRTDVKPMYDQASIVIQDQDMAIVGLEQTFFNVSEDIGVVELCAIVISPNMDPDCPNCPIGFPFDVQLSTFNGDAVAPMDYESLDVIVMFGTCQTKQCVTVTIMDDFENEPDESFFYTLTEPPGGLDSRITLSPTLGEILIRDNDVPIRVGYDPIVYETSESEGMVVLNIRIFEPTSGGAPRPFTLSVSTQEGTAVSPEDYVGVNGEIIQFNTGDTTKTHTIFIEQDQLCETDPIEFFLSNIVFDDGVQPIEVIQPQANIFINDTLEPECEIVVGYEKIVYITPEGMSYVELCAVVTSHNGAPRPFIISATTQDGSAISGDDYVGVVDEILMFAEGVDRVCHNVTILQDDECEILRVEDFFSDLSYVSGYPPITIAPDAARVIIDDSNEPECEPIEVGYDPVVYFISEGQGFVELNIRIFRPLSGMAPRPFTLSISTKDDTAVSNNDYNAVNNEIIQFNTGDTNKRHIITINDDLFCEVPDEQFFSDITLVSGIQMINVTVPRAVVIITNEPDDCVVTTVMVNDTLTGDPLMTVPISIENDVITSLCYEVHGEADKFFNLISDTCVSVNSHYSKAAIDNENITLNIVDSIGVLAYDQGICVNIGVSLKNCQASVNGANVSRYNNNGISVRSFNNRVRISVPNCAPTDLVMWVFCTSGRTEDPYTWKYYDFDFIRFVVMRGLNLDPTSHGLIGQFWNVDVEVEEYTGMFNGEDEDTDYVITVKTPSEKKFVGIKASVTWEFEERPCLYIGNSQAGPLGETVDPGVNDAVIEGTYKDYVVSSMFSPSFTYVRFNMNCPV